MNLFRVEKLLLTEHLFSIKLYQDNCVKSNYFDIVQVFHKALRTKKELRGTSTRGKQLNYEQIPDAKRSNV